MSRHLAWRGLGHRTMEAHSIGSFSTGGAEWFWRPSALRCCDYTLRFYIPCQAIREENCPSGSACPRAIAGSQTPTGQIACLADSDDQLYVVLGSGVWRRVANHASDVLRIPRLCVSLKRQHLIFNFVALSLGICNSLIISLSIYNPAFRLGNRLTIFPCEVQQIRALRHSLSFSFHLICVNCESRRRCTVLECLRGNVAFGINYLKDKLCFQ